MGQVGEGPKYDLIHWCELAGSQVVEVAGGVLSHSEKNEGPDLAKLTETTLQLGASAGS